MKKARNNIQNKAIQEAVRTILVAIQDEMGTNPNIREIGRKTEKQLNIEYLLNEAIEAIEGGIRHDYFVQDIKGPKGWNKDRRSNEYLRKHVLSYLYRLREVLQVPEPKKLSS